jgi:hypothetical protein
MTRECSGCGELINPKRLEILPNTKFCVNCSDSSRKRGVTVQLGEGDHTYTDIVILDEPEFIDFIVKEPSFAKPQIHEVNDFDEDDEKQDFLQNFDVESIEGDFE